MRRLNQPEGNPYEFKYYRNGGIVITYLSIVRMDEESLFY